MRLRARLGRDRNNGEERARSSAHVRPFISLRGRPSLCRRPQSDGLPPPGGGGGRCVWGGINGGRAARDAPRRNPASVTPLRSPRGARLRPPPRPLLTLPLAQACGVDFLAWRRVCGERRRRRRRPAGCAGPGHPAVARRRGGGGAAPAAAPHPTFASRSSGRRSPGRPLPRLPSRAWARAEGSLSVQQGPAA